MKKVGFTLVFVLSSYLTWCLLGYISTEIIKVVQ
jgi:hypothetical protein